MNEQDFTKIVEETKGIVLSAIERYLFFDYYHAIDDVVQETYLRAYKSLENNQFRGDSKFSTWLFTIARNESLRMNQKLTKYKKITDKIIEIELTSPAEPYAEIDDDRLNILKNKILYMPSKYQSVFILYFAGKKEKAISEELSISAGTVKSRLHRGKKMLLELFYRSKEV